ncbi:DsbA family oxidoreductase [Oharaeibacter diazotrophicus]|uniref:Putative DsbA family dithiol-disulfide isomerase n=1 Tax=Oharaeibacter diazotrophicus TaxID=1920512 RepID=A0A4R6RJS6_9HYPH|nr:DsbA family oxidoreductase [Oharaeibacter diazotrophicus]TDP86793.1 putative DsbA family dithiol-disulfide isomerase [Oharaeibacter diazotrophicus]BBE71264.1 DSBA-like thioredoxin domain protein [Pleomorphomonas sp. SM30]GLS78018.1 DSBA oxidoreductase [Oharaeibacter diazotrophicus]
MSLPVTLDVVVDVVCPWCFLGKRRLDAALAGLPDVAATVRYRPFQLDPDLPAEGVERQAYMKAKFGDLGRVDEIHRRLVDMGADVGIAFAFDRIERTPNTLDAHRLIRWAAAEGKGEAMVERLFALYFEEGEDIGDTAVLAAAAEAVGLDGAEIRDRLDAGEDREAVAAEVAEASRIGVTGVPFTILAGKYGLSGAQSTEVFADAIGRVATGG